MNRAKIKQRQRLDSKSYLQHVCSAFARHTNLDTSQPCKRAANVTFISKSDMKRLLLTFLIFLTHTVVWGQFAIRGKVTDKQNNPLEYTSIEIKHDSLTQKIFFSDSLGNFQITNLSNQNYQIQFSHVNYITKNININVSVDINITIQLDKNDNSLKEVIVKSNKPIFERKSDRFIFNIGNTNIAKGISAWDVLKLTPLTMTSEQGGIAISGTDGAKIYINERKSILSGEALMNYLKNISSENVLRIEVITIPSSRFEAEGGAGIINIVLRKSDSEGVKGSLSISNKQATFNSQALDADINVRKKNINIYSYLSTANQNLFFSGFNNIDYINNTGIFYKNNNDIQRRLRNKFEITPRLGLDFYISKKSTFGFLFDYSYTSLKRDNVTKTLFIDIPNTTDSIYKTNSNTTEKTRFFNSNIYYFLLTDTSGGKINLSIDNLYYNETRNTAQTTFLTNAQGNPLLNRDHFTSVLPQIIINNSVAIDYYKPFTQKTLLEIGSKYSKSTTDNNVAFQILNNNHYVNDTTRSNHFRYIENILAFYFNYQQKINDVWNFKLGIRMEKTNTEGLLLNYNQKNINNYTNFFPTFFLNYTPSTIHQFSFAYTSRINRPSFWDINPFRYYVSNSIYITGNPFLLPSRIFKQEITYIYKSKIIFQLTHSKTNDAYALLNYFDNMSTFQKQTNYGTKENSSVNLMYNDKIFSFWYLRLSGNVSLLKFKGKYDRNIINLSSVRSTIEMTNGLTVSNKNKFYASINMSNTFRHFAENTEIGNQFRFNLWLTKISKNDRSVFGLGVTDLLKSTVDNYLTKQLTQYFRERYYYDARSISVSFTYKFGKKSVPDKRERTTSNQEERGRIN